MTKTPADRALASAELSTQERQARYLIELDRQTADFSPAGQVLRSALLAMWASAVSADQLITVGCAIHSSDAGKTEPFKRELARMVRLKVLRTRMSRGVRLYEINF